MRAYFVTLLLFTTFLYSVLATEIPSYIHLCSRSDPEINKCVVKTIYEMIPYLKKGIPEMGLPPVDPLFIPEIRANTGDAATAQLEVKISNITAFGLSNIDIETFNMDFGTTKFTGILHFPQLWLQGSYEGKGKVLLLALDSKGFARFNCSGVTATIETNATLYMKENKTYIRFEKLDLKGKIEEMQVEFEDLFINNPALTEAVNKAINENIKTFALDLTPIAEDVLGKLAAEYFSKPFSLFSVQELFPE